MGKLYAYDWNYDNWKELTGDEGFIRDYLISLPIAYKALGNTTTGHRGRNSN